MRISDRTWLWHLFLKSLLPWLYVVECNRALTFENFCQGDIAIFVSFGPLLCFCSILLIRYGFKKNALHSDFTTSDFTTRYALSIW